MNFFNTVLISEADIGDMKKAVLKAFAIFIGKHVCWSACNTCAYKFIKKRLQTGVSCQYCKIFKKSYFEEHLRRAASIIFSQDYLLYVNSMGAEG